MTQKEFLETVKGTVINQARMSDKEIGNIVIDSRGINRNDVFIAINGNTKNGHDYLKDVITSKPSLILVEEPCHVKTSIPIIQVSDTKKSLFDLGSAFRNKYNIPVIAITGSVGKTTTKELIAQILERKYNLLKSTGNYNNHIGLPLTLFRLKEEHELILVEMGMNHAKEISKLSKLAQPDLGIITNIGTAHIGYLGSIRNIRKAKLEIIDGMDGGTLLLNGNDKQLNKIRHIKQKIMRCGTKTKHDLYAYDVQVYQNNLFFKVCVDDVPYYIQYPYGGAHHITNILLAIQVGLLYDIPMTDIVDAIAHASGTGKRLETKELMNGITLIDDSYNASLESVLADLDYLSLSSKPRVIVFGDILEVGKFKKKIHKQVAREMRKLDNTTILTIGTGSKQIKKYIPSTICHDSVDNLITSLSLLDLTNHIILVKASRKMGLDLVCQYLTNIYQKSPTE